MNDGVRNSGVSDFLGKLQFWTIHCLINAAPSYLIAVVWLELWGSVIAQLAMLAAVITFIVGYAVLTFSLRIFLEKGNLFDGALRVGLIVRMVISVLTIIAVPLGPFLMFTPDFWCGRLANKVVAAVLGVDGLMIRTDRSGGGFLREIGFFEIYFTTILEGLILSFLLFIFSLSAIVILQRKFEKRFYMGR